MGKKKGPGNEERLAAACPRCGALPGAKCTDYRGKGKVMCVERGRPEITAKKDARKAAEKNAKALAGYGGDNTLLTYLYDGADNLLAAEGVQKVTAEDVAEAKLRGFRRAVEDHGHAELAIMDGLNWILVRLMRREAAKLIGAEWEELLWSGAVGTFGNSLSYIRDRYSTILCTADRIVLGYERRFDPARVKTWYLERGTGDPRPPIEMRNDGWYAAPTAHWPPDGYTPVMTREEFRARFDLHHLSVRPAADLSEPDDGGLFERTIGALSPATQERHP